MITISLLTYNGARYLPACIAALQRQTFQRWRLVVLDNGSQDDSVAVARQLAHNDSRIDILPPQAENTGFAAGHNTILRAVRTPYVLLLNQDVVIAPDFLELLLTFIEKNQSAAAVTGLLLRWNPTDSFQLTEPSKTRTIDSAGLRLHRSFRVTDAQSGEEAAAAPQTPREVFGVSGAVPLYRTAAVRHAGYFDEAFFSYKEDVDLAFRLRHAGYGAYIVPAARAYHHRGVGGNEAASNAKTGSRHRSRNFHSKYWAYRNHWYVLLKNVAGADWLRYGAHIGWYELKKFVWLLLFDQKVAWRAWRDIIAAAPRLRTWRAQNKPRSVTQWIR